MLTKFKNHVENCDRRRTGQVRKKRTHQYAVGASSAFLRSTAFPVRHSNFIDRMINDHLLPSHHTDTGVTITYYQHRYKKL